MTRSRLLLAVALATMVCGGPLGAQSPVTPRQRAQLDSLLVDAVAAHRLTSVSAAVIQGSDTLLLKAVGLASLDPERPATRQTVYRLGSVTKQFTAAIMLQMVSERRFELTDTLGRFLPWTPVAWRSVTLSQLLNHTSGIPSYTSLGAAWRQRMTEEMPPDTIILLSARQPMDFAPGSNWRYNNSAYVILGRIIELTDGRSYAESVRERIAKPLGLASLSYCATSPRPPFDATGYQSSGKGAFEPAVPLSMSQPLSAGGLCANALDVVRWNIALHSGRVIPDSLHARMVTPVASATARHYGFGIGRDSTGKRLRFVHSGSVNGFTSSNSYAPDRALSIVVLANTDGNHTDALAEQFRRVMDHEPLLQRPKPIVLTTAQLAVHVGRYEVALPGRSLQVNVRADTARLLVQFDGDAESVMLPIASHRFMMDGDETFQLEFVLSTARVSSIVLHVGPQTFIGRRVEEK